ncbi:hypothetical protein PLCT2_00257 [Planctomycetaceae bacterium]|nr:hypothetical protein PLCT2_00257 [Planctomycetaceae bacterium]
MENNTWERFNNAIKAGNPEEALEILTRDGHLMPERKAEAEEIVKKAKRKPRIKINDVMAAVERDDCTGFCTACGEEQGGCEPDARRVECESCGEKKVYGAEELLFRIA